MESNHRGSPPPSGWVCSTESIRCMANDKGKDVLERLTTIGGAPPPDRSDHREKKRNLPLGKSCWAIFGTHLFGSQTSYPSPLLRHPCTRESVHTPTDARIPAGARGSPAPTPVAGPAVDHTERWIGGLAPLLLPGAHGPPLRAICTPGNPPPPGGRVDPQHPSGFL